MRRLLHFPSSAIAGAAISAIASAALTLLGASVLIFAGIHLVPGGYTDAVLPLDDSPQVRAAMSRHFGLSQPLVVQYVKWLGSLLRGNFGNSLTSGLSVRSGIATSAPATLELTVIATIFTVLVGIPLGSFAALRSDHKLSRGISRALSSVGIAVPSFVLATAVVYLASVGDIGISVGEYVPLSANPGANIHAILLPALVLGVFATGLVARTTRDAVLSVVTEPYITAAVRGARLRYRSSGATSCATLPFLS